MPNLVLFELDRTLIDLESAFTIWAHEFADAHGLGRKGCDYLIKLNDNGVPHRGVFFERVREQFGLRAQAADLWAAYRQRMPHLVQPFPGAIDGLAQLRAEGWRIGIVTNGTAENQLGKLRQTGLMDAVDGYAVSGAEGIRKPEAGLFEIARSGVAPPWRTVDGWSAIAPWRTSRAARRLASGRSGSRHEAAGRPITL